MRIATTSEKGSNLGKRVIHRLITDNNGANDIGQLSDINKVCVWKQWKRIDLIAEVDVNCDGELKKYVIVVENKAYTLIHDDQLSRYSNIIEDYYRGKGAIVRYWVITFFDKDTTEYNTIKTQCEKAMGKWECLSFEEIAELTEDERQNGTGNNIIDEFWIKYWI